MTIKINKLNMIIHVTIIRSWQYWIFRIKVENNTIEYELDNDSLETFLSTADDLIASEIVVEKILETTKKEWKNHSPI